MNRQSITSEDGISRQWFDLDSATSLGKRRRGDWHGSELFRSRGGRWIIYYWSSVQGESDYYRLVSPSDAASWLIAGGYQLPQELVEVAAGSEA